MEVGFVGGMVECLVRRFVVDLIPTGGQERRAKTGGHGTLAIGRIIGYDMLWLVGSRVSPDVTLGRARHLVVRHSLLQSDD